MGVREGLKGGKGKRGRVREKRKGVRVVRSFQIFFGVGWE